MNVETMRAFTGTAVTKEQLVASLEAHAKADSFRQHYGYWRDGKGCAVGCSLRDFEANEADHSAYEKLFGIPRILARLEDGIFEGLPADKAREWPLRFANAVPVGADLSLVWPRFAHWLLVDKEHGVVRFAKEKSKLAIEAVAALYAGVIAGEKVEKEEFRAAAAYAAAYADACADAYADAAAFSARKRAREDVCVAQADKLIELIEACPAAEPAAA